MAQLQAPTKTTDRKAKAMDKASTPASSNAAETPCIADREQAVREAAYALFVARGCEPGHELDDWLTAEAQLQPLQPMPQAHDEPASASAAGQLAH